MLDEISGEHRCQGFSKSIGSLDAPMTGHFKGKHDDALELEVLYCQTNSAEPGPRQVFVIWQGLEP